MFDNVNMNFWERVKILITKENTSWRWIASTVVEKSETTVSGWRSSGVLPRADDAVKIAKALNTSVEYLVTGTEPTYLSPVAFEFFTKSKKWSQVINDLDLISPAMSKSFCETIHALTKEGLDTNTEVENEPRVGNL